MPPAKSEGKARGGENAHSRKFPLKRISVKSHFGRVFFLTEGECRFGDAY